jgi:hypothetical protein
MSENVRAVIERHHSFYEVMPYYILLEERPHGAKATPRRIQAGYDIDVYGIKTSLEPEAASDYALIYAALQEVVKTILPHTSDACLMEVMPFGSTVILNTGRHLQPEGMVRIRIAHGRGLDQPAGAPEERALKEIQEQLHVLGVKPGRGWG